ncbi:MAG TPA: hypothetical protein VJG32_04445 [Anaerolineae bacterium]|nr:hypothetical protein [Anaerolineae bacterium]
MPKAIDADFEMTVARAMLAELEAYLKADVTYWQTAPNALGDRMPKLTIGGLLEALIQAQAAGAAEAQSMRATLELIRMQNLDRYLAHAEQETRSRLDAWNWYLDDYARKPGEVADYYPNEVHARLKAELLLNELEPKQRGRPERERAHVLDERLRLAFTPGALVWDERLKPFFPPDRYWWLYGRLPEPED